jgi:plastocyanin
MLRLGVVVALTGLLGTASAEAATHVVRIGAGGFSPGAQTVKVGDTVTWTWASGIHNVVSDSGLFASGSAVAGPGSFSFTFTSAGTFGYHCTPHGAPGSGESGFIGVLDGIELAHATDLVDDLNGAQDRYHIGQRPFSSYEVVADAVAGNPALLLARTPAAGTPFLQFSAPVAGGIGFTQSLRWQNNTAAGDDGQLILVGNGSCPGACSPNDYYRLRAYETTYAVPRFNNSSTQVTVLLLQNPTDYSVSGTILFWDAAGVLLNTGGQAFVLAAKAALVLPTGTVANVAGKSGTITITNTARYGDLVGKAVALEPATGFSFDSPMVARPK